MPNSKPRKRVRALFRSVLLSALLMQTACSFVSGAKHGTGKVGSMNYLGDMAVAAVASFGCVMAAVAWVSPDSYAPIQGDRTSWDNARDRDSTIATGATWTPIACTTGIAFTASSIYGYYAKDPSDGAADRFNSSFDSAMGGAAVFANGMNNARTQESRAPRPATMPAQTSNGESPSRPGVPCGSDYDCSYGWACVKGPHYSVGTCAQKVDASGTPTFTGPDADSVRHRDTTNCGFDTDCLTGFKCVKQGGQLRGHCMR